MANTISNLLIGIGFDFDKKSQAQVSSGIDGVKSKALQLSRAGLGMAAAGGAALSALTFDFADAADKMGKFSEVYGGTVGDIQALGNAFIKQGGDLNTFLGQLQSVREFQAQLRVGSVGFIQEAQLAGVDTDAIINATSAMEAYLSLSNSVKGASDLGRINIAKAVGGDATFIRLQSLGREEIERQMAVQKQLFNLTKQSTQQAAEFNDAWEDAKTALVGVKAELATMAMPSMTEWLEDVAMGLKLLSQYPDQMADILKGATVDAINDTIGAIVGVSFDDVVGPGTINAGGQRLVPSHMTGKIDRGQPVKVIIENKLMLDGKVISDKIIEVTARQDGEAIQNLMSSTDR